MDMFSGQKTVSNPLAATPFHSEIASGCYLLLHRPAGKGAGEGGNPHAGYFQGKKRLWEVRFQCRFHRPVKASSLRFASSPFVRRHVGLTQLAVHRWLIKVAGPSLRGLYNSPGDDPSTRAPDDAEHPVTSIPVCEIDQHIEHRAGEAPPDLLDPNFPRLGRLKTQGTANHRRAISELTFNAGETHTFAFWGPSRFVNLLEWQFESVPMFEGRSLSMVNGPPPLYLALYQLSPGIGQETRHLNSRMCAIWRVAGWSSQCPPTLEVQAALQQSVGARNKPDARKRRAKSSALGCYSWWARRLLCLGHGHPGRGA